MAALSHRPDYRPIPEGHNDRKLRSFPKFGIHLRVNSSLPALHLTNRELVSDGRPYISFDAPLCRKTWVNYTSVRIALPPQVVMHFIRCFLDQFVCLFSGHRSVQEYADEPRCDGNLRTIHSLYVLCVRLAGELAPSRIRSRYVITIRRGPRGRCGDPEYVKQWRKRWKTWGEQGYEPSLNGVLSLYIGAENMASRNCRFHEEGLRRRRRACAASQEQ